MGLMPERFVRSPRIGDILRHRRYGEYWHFRVSEVSGKARKVHGPGYVVLDIAADPEFRMTMCGTQWLRWASAATLIEAGPTK